MADAMFAWATRAAAPPPDPIASMAHLESVKADGELKLQQEKNEGMRLQLLLLQEQNKK
jgi:hypothetical protein